MHISRTACGSESVWYHSPSAECPRAATSPIASMPYAILMYGSNMIGTCGVSLQCPLSLLRSRVLDGLFVPLRRIVSKSVLYIRGVTHSGLGSMDDREKKQHSEPHQELKPFTVTIISTRVFHPMGTGSNEVFLSHLGGADPRAKLGLCHPVVPPWPCDPPFRYIVAPRVAKTPSKGQMVVS